MCAALLAAACGGEGTGEPARVYIPQGASFAAITDSLTAHEMIRYPLLFKMYARATGAAGRIQAGMYEFRRHTGWQRVLGDLASGNVVTARLVIPEGWNTRDIAGRVAPIVGLPADSVRHLLIDSAYAQRWRVAGPSLEGYLYPATYTFPAGAPMDTVVARLVEAYRRVWTADRQARAAAQDLTERQVVTLASIIEKEARRAEEMPVIAAVYRNRLRIGIPLQADPTVQYALGVHRDRLLYASIDSVADHPYNTYRRAGLPPGPIASPSERAIDAALTPAPVNYLYFVARPDGSHIFTRSLEEHNRAKAQVRRESRNQRP
jgi:UPF0755 protein